MRDPKSIIYSDSDGVLADFEAAAHHVLGQPWSATTGNRREKGDKLNKHPKFWETIPPMHDFRVLRDFIEKFHPHILTAVPSEPWKYSFQEVERGKREWYHKHIPSLPQSRIHIVYREDKSKYAMNGKTQNILIDDHKKNVQEFEAAGGIGVLHHNAKTTIIQLRLLGYH
jgi:5'(3')-deoxyribonucleotidase